MFSCFHFKMNSCKYSFDKESQIHKVKELPVCGSSSTSPRVEPHPRSPCRGQQLQRCVYVPHKATRIARAKTVHVKASHESSRNLRRHHLHQHLSLLHICGGVKDKSTFARGAFILPSFRCSCKAAPPLGEICTVTHLVNAFLGLYRIMLLS